MTNDPQVYRGFVSVNLSSFYSGQIFLVVHLKICPLQPKFVKLLKTIHTSEMLQMTENLSK